MTVFIVRFKISVHICFQFNSYDPVDGRITEWEFADMLLTYSSFHAKKKQKILRKVKKSFKENSQVGQNIE